MITASKHSLVFNGLLLGVTIRRNLTTHRKAIVTFNIHEHTRRLIALVAPHEKVLLIAHIRRSLEILSCWVTGEYLPPKLTCIIERCNT